MLGPKTSPSRAPCPTFATATLSKSAQSQFACTDTIEVGPIAIRLQGIAAPEGNEPGGAAATDVMRDLVLGEELRCDLTGDRSHDRVIGVCFLDDGRDVGEVMVFQGQARDCYRFSRGRYADAERHARTMGHDISQIYALPEYCE